MTGLYLIILIRSFLQAGIKEIQNPANIFRGIEALPIVARSLNDHGLNLAFSQNGLQLFRKIS